MIWISEVQLLHGDHPFETLPNPDRLQGSYQTEFFLFFQNKSAKTVLLVSRSKVFHMETIMTARNYINLPVEHKHLIEAAADEVAGKHCLDISQKRKKSFAKQP